MKRLFKSDLLYSLLKQDEKLQPTVELSINYWRDTSNTFMFTLITSITF